MINDSPGGTASAANHSGDADWAPLVPAFWANPDPPADAVDGGSRWFSGENESMADPTLGYSHGEIPGFTIFQPVAYSGMASYTESLTGFTHASDLFRRFYQTTRFGWLFSSGSKNGSPWAP